MSRRNAEHWLAPAVPARGLAAGHPAAHPHAGERQPADRADDRRRPAGRGGRRHRARAGSPGRARRSSLIQVYFLLDLCDGEVARWRRTTSITGVYLDRVGHYLVEAAAPVGVRLPGRRVQELGGWSTLGVAAGLLRGAGQGRVRPRGRRPGALGRGDGHRRVGRAAQRRASVPPAAPRRCSRSTSSPARSSSPSCCWSRSWSTPPTDSLVGTPHASPCCWRPSPASWSCCTWSSILLSRG